MTNTFLCDLAADDDLRDPERRLGVAHRRALPVLAAGPDGDSRGRSRRGRSTSAPAVRCRSGWRRAPARRAAVLDQVALRSPRTQNRRSRCSPARRPFFSQRAPSGWNAGYRQGPFRPARSSCSSSGEWAGACRTRASRCRWRARSVLHRRQPVIHERVKHSPVHQHGPLRVRAFVIKTERTPFAGKRCVIDDRDQRRGYQLPAFCRNRPKARTAQDRLRGHAPPPRGSSCRRQLRTARRAFCRQEPSGPTAS